MLLCHVARNCKDVSFGRADGFVIRDPQQAKVNLLDDIWNVSDITHAGTQKAPQVLAVPERKLLDESFPIARTPRVFTPPYRDRAFLKRIDTSKSP